MEPLYYVMAIMGCADGGDLCAQSRVVPARYTSYQACQAAMEGELLRAAALDFPELQAACQASRPALADRRAPTRGG